MTIVASLFFVGVVSCLCAAVRSSACCLASHTKFKVIVSDTGGIMES